VYASNCEQHAKLLAGGGPQQVYPVWLHLQSAMITTLKTCMTTTLEHKKNGSHKTMYMKTRGSNFPEHFTAICLMHHLVFSQKNKEVSSSSVFSSQRTRFF
jgi:hypothetical protein